MIIMLSVDDDVAKLNQYKNKYCIVSVETKSKDLFVQLLSRSKKKSYSSQHFIKLCHGFLKYQGGVL